MKQIKAFEATDGTPFFTEAECLVYEQTSGFDTWYFEQAIPFPSNVNLRDLLSFLLHNAEAIRGFLPPVETTKPELDIEVLREYGKYYASGDLLVNIKQIQKWLAGELK